MYKHLPALMIVCGILLMVGSFLFSAANALPYQDPTAEQLAQQASKAAMYRLTFYIGALDLVAGLCLWWVRKKKKAVESQSATRF